MGQKSRLKLLRRKGMVTPQAAPKSVLWKDGVSLNITLKLPWKDRVRYFLGLGVIRVKAQVRTQFWPGQTYMDGAISQVEWKPRPAAWLAQAARLAFWRKAKVTDGH